jgi:hypothetical protein
MILTHPALTKLTFMDYLLTMLRILLQRKLDHDTIDDTSHVSCWCCERNVKVFLFWSVQWSARPVLIRFTHQF